MENKQLSGSFLKCPEDRVLGPAKARNWKFSPALLCEWKECSYVSYVAVSQGWKLKSESRSWKSNPGALIWEAGAGLKVKCLSSQTHLYSVLES